MAEMRITQLMVTNGVDPLPPPLDDARQVMEKLLPMLQELQDLALWDVSIRTEGVQGDARIAEAITAWQSIRTTLRTMRFLTETMPEWYGWAACATAPNGVDDKVMDAWTVRLAQDFSPRFIAAMNS